MIPPFASVQPHLDVLHTVCFTFGNAREHFHEMRYPIVNGKLDLIVEPTDAIQGADLSFCRYLNVWIDAVDQKDFRRAAVLWKELLKIENRPARIFAQTEKGLRVFDPYENKRIDFNHE